METSQRQKTACTELSSTIAELYYSTHYQSQKPISPTASRISGILMTTNEALSLIKQAEKNMSGKDVAFTVTDDIRIDDTAHLFLFENDYCKAAAVGYESGELFVMRDWQEPSRPETAEEIADYDWCTIDWQDAIIFDGLPRTL